MLSAFRVNQYSKNNRLLILTQLSRCTSSPRSNDPYFVRKEMLTYILHTVFNGIRYANPSTYQIISVGNDD